MRAGRVGHLGRSGAGLVVTAALVVCMLVPGCADFSAPGSQSAADPLAYYDWLATLATEEIGEEQRRLRGLQQPGGPGEPAPLVPRVQLALLLLYTEPAGAAGRGEAAGLLRQAVDTGAENALQRDYQTLARLQLTALETERVLERWRRSAVEREKEIEALREQIQRLTVQIEQLKVIEQRLMEREQAQENDG